jgi:hypothetical protein
MAHAQLNFTTTLRKNKASNTCFIIQKDLWIAAILQMTFNDIMLGKSRTAGS